MDIASWLRSLGLGEYEPTFREHKIDSEVLTELAEPDLEKLAIPLGHRKRLLKAIRALQTEAPASEPTTLPASEPALDSSQPAERRQVTVMFCDLVGSTALSTRLDPEDLREVIGGFQRRMAQTISQFEGFVARYLGDGVLAYFGYPHAHEDDAEQAVRAGLALIDAVGGRCHINCKTAMNLRAIATSSSGNLPRARFFIPAPECLSACHSIVAGRGKVAL
jgi:SAM domain (Sterile alpha motif)/Adenylate and Guanylate cyclase catalytic domain